MKWLFNSDLALLILRVSFGGLIFVNHGLAKIQNFSLYSQDFYDPFGLGPTISLALATFAEVFCSAALVLGLKTRYVAFPLFVTMVVAAFGAHASDPLAVKEMALLFGTGFLVLIMMGGGKFSLDTRLPSK